MLTVLTPATNFKLTTIEAVKSELGIVGTAEDAWIADAIDRASDTITRFCNCVLTREVLQETIVLKRPTESLMLTRFPVVIADVEVTVDGTGALTEVDGFSGLVYRLDASGNRICWPAGRIVVIYGAGYILPADVGRDLPHDIERAAILVVKASYFSRQRDPLLKSESIEDAVQSSWWMGGLPPEVEGILSRYRQVAL
jgi:hypothetical protein